MSGCDEYPLENIEGGSTLDHQPQIQYIAVIINDETKKTVLVECSIAGPSDSE